MRYSSDYARAKKRVAKRKGFYTNLIVYVAINLWFFFNGHFNYTVAFWWGFGLMFHYLSVFGLPGSGVLSKDWEEREIQKEMDKMNRPALPPTEQEPLEMPDYQKRTESRKNWSEDDLV